MIFGLFKTMYFFILHFEVRNLGFISLYSQAFCDELLLLFGFFTLGFLLFLELSGGSIATLARISGKHPQITEKEVTIGNPLGGIEIRNFKRFQDYWFGEVIFVS
ncbi:hypothetical protein CwatDRAFT_4579 [Crocosphaera watsonii WH 8501]|uniref:Uncharacterized protein n=2 Tax=Crocosphaera watsonii TaxID=263511 RepID=Q4C5B3_CROWT|nr:hypothetical protein CwatDRAFT_4579 [Crocosphaera watsonii WH 8501]